jgi:uncharacterized protein (TIGR02466 family)
MIFEQTQALTLFPTFVWAHDLPAAAAQELNRHLEQAILKLIEPRPKLLPGQTWQTHQDLHRRPEFAELVRLIRSAAAGVLDYLQVEHEGFEITGCWANVNPDGSPHSTHTHPNNYLSGVYYGKTGPGADSVRFVDPRPQIHQISPRVKKQGPMNAPQAFVDAPAGRLVLFPAWLAHSVPQNASGHERISVAFNVMFSDFTRRMAMPKWEGIKAGGYGES